MRKHNGIRPQDIVILLKIASLSNENWQLSTLSASLQLSISEISESLNRSKLAKLINEDKKIIEFIISKLKNSKI
jgi:predicted transcriptional regulator